MKLIKPKRALLSVSDKTGIVELAKALHAQGVEIISTGGTANILHEAQIPVQEVSEFTGFPEIMSGRVKTLHPKIFAGILGRRDEHAAQAKEYNLPWIDLVVCNLYPFAKTIAEADVTFERAVENIDIGGPSMVRAAAKNMAWATIVVDHADYSRLIEAIEGQGISFELRQALAAKAFSHTAFYDALISNYLCDKPFSEKLTLPFSEPVSLRYGENPHQEACVYHVPMAKMGVLQAKQHQGKPLSYNNILDADSALQCVLEFQQPTCVVVKHANPCGVATADHIDVAFARAWEADAKSAFGGIIALNRPCTEEIALALTKYFVEVFIAPGFSKEARQVLAKKPNLRVLDLSDLPTELPTWQYRSVMGGLLVQHRDDAGFVESDLQCVTDIKPSDAELTSMAFAWHVLKHIKSNGILIAKDNATLGVGAGQVSRIDAVDLAIRKAGEDLSGAVLASDAFFPFRDSIDRIATTGIRAIIQPGGSKRDDEVIAACNEHGIAMVFTGKRCFKH